MKKRRVKLATELSRRATGKTVYLLDEPTTGLHFADVEKLLHVLHRLVDNGNTVVVIEHNLDVIKTADWIIDLGPEGGARGGLVIGEGTPEAIARVKGSATGEYLARVLRGEPLVPLSDVTFAEAAGRGNGRRARQVTAVATATLAGDGSEAANGAAPAEGPAAERHRAPGAGRDAAPERVPAAAGSRRRA
jgi:excinuclease ABC subunit A